MNMMITLIDFLNIDPSLETWIKPHLVIHLKKIQTSMNWFVNILSRIVTSILMRDMVYSLFLVQCWSDIDIRAILAS